jgi:hypothetical protein
MEPKSDHRVNGKRDMVSSAGSMIGNPHDRIGVEHEHLMSDTRQQGLVVHLIH